MMDFTLACWNDAVQDAGSTRCYVMDNEDADIADVAERFVVAPQADADRIDALLAAGAAQVLLGDSALRDESLVRTALLAHGAERIGIWMQVHRTQMSWGLDTSSNADFSVVAVTNPIPRWVVLMADGSATDVDAIWWAEQMAAVGCATVLVSVADPEDDDLLACAEMAECLGERFWLDTASTDVEELRFWRRYGQVSQLVLPDGSDAKATAAALEQRLAQDGVGQCTG